MRTDKFGRQILTENDLCNFYLADTSKNIKSCIIEHDISISSDLEIHNLPNFISYVEETIDIETWDNLQQQKYFVPDSYRTFNIAEYILDKCNSETELQRAGQELLLYQERNLFPLLLYLKYLVDIMKREKIVWGVGRGSSVASFVLYLLEVHRINSLYYDLSIDEFLKS
jgi:DNA polymerase III alpha subunit